MSEQKEHDRQFPVRFTLAQRIVVAEVFPKFSERLRLDEPNQRMVALTLDELKVICRKVAPWAFTGVVAVALPRSSRASTDTTGRPLVFQATVPGLYPLRAA